MGLSSQVGKPFEFGARNILSTTFSNKGAT
jgi:hypothetical protein